MPTTHVYAPTMGVINSAPPSGIAPQASPYMKGIYLKYGEVRSDFGHVDYPTTGDTTTNALNGDVMRIDQFFKADGTSSLICLTTTNAYKYNTTTGTWDVITQGYEIENCDAAWTGGTGVSVVPYDDIKLRDQTSARHCVLDHTPVAHFPLNDDAADTDVEDIAGDNTATASANTDTLSVAAVVDDGFDFEFATSHYVTIGAAMAAQYTDTVGSISVWVNVESLTAERIICAGSDASGTAMLVLSVTTAGAVRAYMHNGTAMQWDIQTADACIVAGTDYHIVLTQNGTAAKIYLDTEDEGLVLNTSTDLTTWFVDIAGVDTALLGAVSTGGTGAEGFFDGIMDEWRYYDEVISVREIGGLYNDGEGTDQIEGFTTGVMGYMDDPTTTDISSTTINTHLSFWIRADKAIAAEVLSIRISEQAAGATGATFADYFVPALVADTWQQVVVDITDPDAETGGGGTFPDDLNAVAGVALVANSDPGACVVYVDDIRTIKMFTGDADNRFSIATMNDTYICTNGVDQPQKYTGSGVFADLVTTLASGTITTSEIVLAFKDHLCLMNNTENASDCPARVSWTNIGKIEGFVKGTAGYQDLVDDESWIIGAKLIGENEVIIYKERSIVKMEWVGGHTPLRFKTMVSGTGLVGKDAFTDTGKEHFAMDTSVIYKYKGGTDIEIIDDNVRPTIYINMDKTYQNRTFMLYVEGDDELQLWTPTTTQYPDDVWCFNTIKGNWYRKDRTMTGYGFFDEQATLTIADLVGTIGDQNWTFGDATTKANTPITLVGDSNGKVYKLSTGTFNNDGVAITNEWQTPDFVLPDTEDYMNKFMRVHKLYFEAYGQSVITTYSTDGGSTWSPTSTVGNNTTTLVTTYDLYEQDFDVVCRKIRFKFYNNTASSSFNLRYYGFDWKLRSGRR